MRSMLLSVLSRPITSQSSQPPVFEDAIDINCLFSDSMDESKYTCLLRARAPFQTSSQPSLCRCKAMYLTTLLDMG